MATVYRALDTRLGRTVAVKVLHPEYARDQPFLQRFQQEAEFAASLGAHPNIVAIYDVGQDDRVHYIVMELVEGRNLKDLIRERAPFPVAGAFAIGRQVASALEFAHKRGLVHRDVKPQNILVTPEGTAKVTDFGIAHGVSASQLTQAGMVIGTVHYFSPEQAQGKTAAPASDIYSLGIILYEMLTGHLPFDADTPIGVAMQHLHNEPPSPWDYNPDLPARAVVPVMRALSKDPNRRFRDAAEFAAALAAVPTETGGTTVLTPLVEPTQVFRPVENVERRARAPIRETRAAPVAVPDGGGNTLRTLALVFGALILIGALAVAAFLVAGGNVFGGATATATPSPTATATATPKPPKRHKPKPTATIPVFVPPAPTNTSPPLSTFTPTFVPATSTPQPPKPTFTSAPLPTFTPIPKVPAPSPTIQFTGGATPTPTPFG